MCNLMSDINNRLKFLLIVLFYFNGVFSMNDIPENYRLNTTSEHVELITPESLSLDNPSNYREIMPKEFIRCAQLASEEKFNEGIECIKNINNKKHCSNEKIRSDLEEVYTSANKKFSKHQKSLDPRFTIKDFIYEDLLRYFWWSHYYPVYEGLVQE